MNFNEILLFKHLAATLSFTRTSREKNISLSALSRTIQRLEEETGQILFIRNNKTVVITEKGKQFLKFSDKVLIEYYSMQEEFQSEGTDIHGIIRLYASFTASNTILMDLLRKYQKTYPNVHIDLQTGSASGNLNQILNGNRDIIIAAKMDKMPPSLAFQHLLENNLYFIAPKNDCPIKEKIKNTLDWETIPFILSDTGYTRKRTDNWFRKNKLHPEIYAQVSGNEAITTLVALGFGIGIVPEIVIENSPVKKGIEIIKNAPHMESYSVGLCAAKRSLKSPVIKAFWDIGENG